MGKGGGGGGGGGEGADWCCDVSIRPPRPRVSGVGAGPRLGPGMFVRGRGVCESVHSCVCVCVHVCMYNIHLYTYV
jgi:hypothetical protein